MEAAIPYRAGLAANATTMYADREYKLGMIKKALGAISKRYADT